jgi:hypothetical protein
MEVGTSSSLVAIDVTSYRVYGSLDSLHCFLISRFVYNNWLIGLIARARSTIESTDWFVVEIEAFAW